MVDKLPLLIFEDEKIIYANFAVGKIFDCHSFMLKGVDIGELFKKPTINSINKLTAEREITVKIKNGDSYTVVVSKSINLIIIRFLHPNGEIPKTVVNIKTDNNQMQEYILNYNKTKIDNLINELRVHEDDPKQEQLKKSFNKFCDDITDLIYEIKSSHTPSFSVFEICEVVRNVINRLSDEGKANIRLVTLIENGYVTGDKEKLVILLNELLTLESSMEVTVYEAKNEIKVMISKYTNDKTEFSELFTRKESDYLWRVFANSAGCNIFSQRNESYGIRNVLVYETQKVYRTCTPDNDVYIERKVF